MKSRFSMRRRTVEPAPKPVVIARAAATDLGPNQITWLRENIGKDKQYGFDACKTAADSALAQTAISRQLRQP